MFKTIRTLILLFIVLFFVIVVGLPIAWWSYQDQAEDLTLKPHIHKAVAITILVASILQSLVCLGLLFYFINFLAIKFQLKKSYGQMLFALIVLVVIVFLVSHFLTYFDQRDYLIHVCKKWWHKFWLMH